METTGPRRISVIEPIGAAIEKTKEILFQPFDLGKWFAMGFCAWLAAMGEGGGGNGNFNFNGGNHSGGSCGSNNFNQEVHQFKEAVVTHLPVIISVAVVIFLFIVVISILLMWLKSRGQFMFLHCVAHNVGEVVMPWKQYARSANSLFLFRLGLGLIGLFLGIALVVPLIVVIISFAETEFKVFAAPGVLAVIFIVLTMILLGIVFGVIKAIVHDFVVPIMYLNDCNFSEGFKRFWTLFKANLGSFVVFLLFLIVVNMVLGMIAMAAILAACCVCCIGIIFFIPYIGTVAMLPLLVWRRAYSAIFLSQFGPAYNVFVGSYTAVPVSAQPIPPFEPPLPPVNDQDMPPGAPE